MTIKNSILIASIFLLAGCGGGGTTGPSSASVGGNRAPVFLFTTDFYSGSPEVGLGSIERTNRMTYSGDSPTMSARVGTKIVYLQGGEVRVMDGWPAYAHANDHAIPNIPSGVSTISGPTLVFCKDGVFKINLDGTGLTQLRPSGTFGQLTPDGTKLAYIDGGHVFVADALGQSPVQLSSMTADFLTVNNTTAVFHSGSALYSVSLSGGTPVLLAPTDTFQGACFLDSDNVLFGSKPREFDDQGHPIEIPTDFGDIFKVSLSSHVVTKYLDLGKNDGNPSFVGSYADLGGI